MEELRKKHELMMLINRAHAANRWFEEATIADLAAPVWLGTIAEARAYLAEHRPLAGILQFPFEGIEWEDVLELLQTFAGTTRLAVLAEDLDVSRAVEAVKAGAVDILLPDQWHTLAERLPRWLGQGGKVSRSVNKQVTSQSGANLFILIDKDYRVLDTNETHAQRFGMHRVDMVGKSLHDFLPSEVLIHRQAWIDQVVATGQPFFGDDSRGGYFNQVSMYPVQNQNGDIDRVAVFVQDITDRKNFEESQHRHIDRLESLVAILNQKTETIQELLGLALNELIELTGSRFGYIYFYNEETQQFTLHNWSNAAMAECMVAEPQQVYDLSKTGIWGEVVRQGKTIIVNDFQAANPLKKGYPEGHVALHSFMTVPVFDGDAIVAVVGVANKASDYTRADELQVSLLMDSVWKVVAQRRTAEEYARLAARMQHYVESSPVILFGLEFTNEGAQLRWASGNVENYLGYSVEETATLDWWRSNGLDEGVPNLQNISEWQDNTSDNFVREYRFRHKDGHAIWVQEDIRILRDDLGEPKEAITAWTDITERKQAERELREQKELLDKIFDLLPIGLWLADENGKLLRGNPMGVKIWGAEPLVPVDEYGVFKARRLPSGEEITPEDWALAHSIREGVTITDELLEIDAFDGETRIIYNYTAPIKDDDNKVTGAIVMNRDVTQQYQAEQALRESEARLRMVIASASEAIILQDRTGVILTWNQEAERIFGVSEADVVGQPSTSREWRVYREDGSLVPGPEHPSMLILSTDGTRRNVVLKVVRDDGDFSWISINTNPVFWGGEDTPDAVVITVRDITDQRAVQERLLFQASLLEAAGDAMVATDPDGIITYWNLGAERTYGWQAEEVLGRNIIDVTPSRQTVAQAQAIMQALRAGETWSGEFLVTHMDGHEFPAYVTDSPVYDDAGKLIAIIGTSFDLSEQKQMQAELAANYALLRMAGETAKFGGWRVDLAANIFKWSDAVADILEMPCGYSPSIDVALSFFAAEWHTKITQVFMACVEEGIPYDEEMQIITAKGNRVWVRTIGEAVWDEQGNITGVNGAFQDISKRKEAGIALRESESKFRALFHNNHAVMWIVDPVDGRIIDANLAASRYYGWSVEELCQKHIHEINTLTAKVVEDELVCPICGERSFFKAKHRLASGEVRDVDIITGPVEFEGKKLWYSLIHDVTERVKAQAKTLRYLQLQETLVRLGKTLGSTLDLDMVYRTVRRFVLEVIPAENFGIAIYNTAQATICFEYVYAAGHQLDVTQIPTMAYDPQNPLFKRSQAIASREAVIVDDHLVNVGATGGKLFRTDGIAPQSALYVPMLSEGEPIGLIDLQSYQPNAFSASDAEWLGVVANQVGMAIKNAQLYDQIRSRLTQLNGLRDIDSFITSHLPLEQILKSILDLVQFQLPVDAADILILEEESNLLRSVAAFGFKQEAIGQVVLSADQSQAGEVLRTQKPVAFVSQETDAYVLDQWFIWQQEQFKVYVGVPLMINRDVKGVLEVFRREPDLLDAQSQHFLEILAGQAAIAIDQHELFDGLQRSNEELRQAYDATIEGWSQAMDLRDRETEGHTQRVTALTCWMAQEYFHFDEEELLWMRRGALLHDIGKLGVPDSILLKEGPLTPEEWVIMKTHPHMAYEMIVSIDYLRDAVDIPHFHHEKWDGSGYPHGLAGQDIPLAARIFAIVDVWDALTSDRPYRKAWSEEDALQFIREQAGKHFDPAVVEAFFAVMQRQP
jgi:PAS domain S-box-containing protein